MKLFKDGDVLEVVLYPEDVESAVRQFIYKLIKTN